MGLMGGIDGNNLQCALDTFHYMHTCTDVPVHEYHTTRTYKDSQSVECRALYKVRIHYTQRKIYKHHVRLVRLYEYKTVLYECTTTHNLFLVQLYVLYNVLNIVGFIQCLKHNTF